MRQYIYMLITFVFIVLTGMVSCRPHKSFEETIPPFDTTKKIRVNDEFTISYEVNGSIRMGVDLLDSNFKNIKLLRIESDEVVFDENSCIGCGIIEHWIFKALKPGIDTASFVQYHNDDDNWYPDTTYVNIIRVQE